MLAFYQLESDTLLKHCCFCALSFVRPIPLSIIWTVGKTGIIATSKKKAGNSKTKADRISCWSQTFTTNVIVKQRNMTLEEANVWLESTLGPLISEGNELPTLEQHWLRSSDWTPGRIDLIADVPAFQSCRSFRNKPTQQRVLQRLRSEIQ